MIAKGEGKREWEMIANWYKVSLVGDENILKLDSGDYIYDYKYTKKNGTVHFKMVNFMVY